MSDQTIVILMIFAIVFLVAQSFVQPLMGSSARARQRLRERINNLAGDQQADRHLSLVRERYLKDLSPLEVKLLGLPGMDQLQTLIDQAGSSQRPHHLVLASLTFALAAGGAMGYLLQSAPAAVLMGLMVGALPFMMLMRKRSERLARFEEQLPDALTVMSRAMRAGLPFTEALNLVSQEMKPPVGQEFGIIFTEINYGGDARSALLGLLERVPNVAVMAMVTSVLIQRDTGGNLAELLDKLSEMVRQRFRFQRSVKTLSAEGRLGAWIMSLLPFVLAGILSITTPDFIPMLTEDPLGRKLILAAFGLMVVGILWMRAIVRIDV